jgi:hypothetical protein
METPMTRRIRVRGKFRRPLGEDQLAMALLMHARALREEKLADSAAKVRGNGKKPRAR